MTDMKRFTQVIVYLILISSFLLSSCGSSDNNAATASSDAETSQEVDIITKSQQTRNDLANNIATAQSVLSSVSSDGVPVDSTDVIRHTSGTAPSTYKPQGQMATYKYRRYNTDSILSHSTGPDTITIRNPQSQQSSSSSSTAPF